MRNINDNTYVVVAAGPAVIQFYPGIKIKISNALSTKFAAIKPRFYSWIV